MRRPIARWLLCTLVAGCAPAAYRAPQASRANLGQATAPRSAPDASVAWSATRRLNWNDYKATAPEDGVEGARTVYLLSYESRCRGAAFQFYVTAVFLPLQSWVKTSVVRDERESARVLQHERTHFDITEVHARRIRKYFAGLYNPCGQTEEHVRSFIDRYVEDEAATQRRYDEETRFGLAPDHQRIWDHDISEMLKSLADFAEK